MTLPVGKDLVVLGGVWPSLAGLVVGGFSLLSPTFAWWTVGLLLWFVASLPSLAFVFRGLSGSLSPESPSTSRGVLAAGFSIPIVCLGLYLGGVIFFSISPPQRFA